ncbi:tRNA pseudouridine(38-40) synthase TruA [Algihabitans albus]|uniref:tRNA pseudouridine(38-40) synthase TruA n=1 Tax=Algihabitans albus TaxID=2164067 RepID=UPI000E5CFB10|nr:tRNA pseudouridine(38-40) synthase TruA [Algihabitans albus]
MTRYKLILEYDGSPFVGWQRQDNGPSVQAALEEAVFGFCGERTTVQGAGRTDTGVHATGQVAHVDIEKSVESATVAKALNAHLKPAPIAVLAAEPVGEDFHARFSATGRRYLYRILCRPAPPAVLRGQVWWVPQRLDPNALQAGADRLLGHHDFSSFRASECQAASPEKTLDELRIEARDCGPGGLEIKVHAAARSFLHHQVRNMVGTLRLVGQGKWSPERVTQALEARDRRAAGPTAPAAGLYLTDVTY